ncbi:hypothetical protein QAD02_013899 [Eretmocerus hayati]|uniref:Uncharacterized protein n=1 Tax=Eretmocerus hayati TaxID=131215 RepID=A0ACC2P402_9HYME|nr:hypothetical protein QAD02_013899 [Eretmocerus hayati]
MIDSKLVHNRFQRAGITVREGILSTHPRSFLFSACEREPGYSRVILLPDADEHTARTWLRRYLVPRGCIDRGGLPGAAEPVIGDSRLALGPTPTLGPLQDLSDFAGAEDTFSVAAGIIGLKATGLGRRIAIACLRDLMRNFQGKLWGHNGPGVITRTLQKFCAVQYVSLE